MTSWPTRTEEQQESFSKLCATFYEDDGLFICNGEGMKVAVTGPHEATIECFGPSGRQKINHVDTTSIDPCLLKLT